MSAAYFAIKASRARPGSAPVNGALFLEDAERRLEIPGMHPVEGALLVGVGDAPDLVQFGRAVFLPQGAEHAAALDAGELPVVAHQNQLGSGLARLAVTSARCLVESMAASSTMSTVRACHWLEPFPAASSRSRWWRHR